MLELLADFPDFAVLRTWLAAVEAEERNGGAARRAVPRADGGEQTFFVGGPYDTWAYLRAVQEELIGDRAALEEVRDAVHPFEDATMVQGYGASDEIPIDDGLFLVESGEVVTSWKPRRGASPRYTVLTRGHVLGEASLRTVLWPDDADRTLALSRSDLLRNPLERYTRVPMVEAYALTSARLRRITKSKLTRLLRKLETSERLVVRELSRIMFTLLRSLYMRALLYDRIVDGFRAMSDFRLVGDDHMRRLLGALRYLRFDRPTSREDMRLHGIGAGLCRTCTDDSEVPGPCVTYARERPELAAIARSQRYRSVHVHVQIEDQRAADGRPPCPPDPAAMIECFRNLYEQHTAGIYLVLEGSIEARARREGFRHRVASPAGRPVVHTGDFAEDTLLEIRPGTAAVQIPMRTVFDVLRCSTAFRRNFLERARPSSVSGRLARLADVSSTEWVGVTVAEGYRGELQLDTLARNLAASMYAQFGDRVVVVHVGSRRPQSRKALREFERFHEITQCPPNAADLMTRVEADRKKRASARRARKVTADAPDPWSDAGWWLLDHWGVGENHKYDYGLIVFERGRRDHRAYFHGVVSKWLVLTDDPWHLVGDDLQPRSDVTFLPVVVTEEHRWRSVGGSRRRELRGGRQRAPAVEYARTHPMRAVRVRLHRGNTDARENPRYLDERSTQRLARAVTGRLVGIALGGGGALGYSHLPLIRKLREADVPIDIVSGTSFGAIVGGYYAALGRPGLDKLERTSMRIVLASWLSFAHPTLLEKFLEHELGDRRLDELETVFIPFATNAFTMEPVVPVARRLSQAMTASGALPILVASPAGGETRYIDGGFVANTPSEVLAAAGAGFVVRSDPITPPPSWEPVYASEVLPRLWDVVRSAPFVPRLLRGEPAGGDPTAVVRTRDGAIEDGWRLLATSYRGSARSTELNAWNPIVRLGTDIIRGLQLLLFAQSDTSRRAADIVFSPAVGGVERVLAFAWPSRVVEPAMRELFETQVIARTVEAWRRMQRPVSVDPCDLDGWVATVAKQLFDDRVSERAIACQPMMTDEHDDTPPGKEA